MDIPGYKLGREVLASKYCTTFNALDVSHSKTVIVKVFNKELSSNPSFRAHFKSIANLLLNQQLDNNVQILDYIIKDESCILVTTYCPRSITKDKKTEKLPESKVLAAGLELATSLSLLHDLGIVHAGVELANIHFNEDNKAVLGTVAFHRTMPGTDPVKFTIYSLQEAVYRAPESGDGFTSSTDFFSLGVVLYKLLTGHYPYKTENIKSVLEQSQMGDFTPLQDNQKYLQPLFDGLLTARYELRISNAADFRLTLNQCIKDYKSTETEIIKQPDAKPVKPLQQQAPASHGNKILSAKILSAASIIAILAIALFIFLIPDNKDETERSENSPYSEENTKTVVTATPADTSQESTTRLEMNAHLADAREQMKNGSHDAAVQAIQEALKIDGQNAEAQQLKTEIDQEFRIRTLIAKAEIQFANQKFHLPFGDNALETYTQISLLTPRGDTRADQGIMKIADHYLELAKRQIEEIKLDEAEKTLSQGLIVKSDYEPLLNLKLSLNAMKNRIADSGGKSVINTATDVITSKPIIIPSTQPQQPPGDATEVISIDTASVKLENEKRPARQKQIERDRKAQSQAKARRLAGERKQQLQQQREFEADQAEKLRIEQEQARLAKLEAERVARQQQQNQREAEINRLLASAENQLNAGSLSQLALDTAMNEYRSLQKITENDSRVTGLFRKIVNSHNTLAEQQEQARQLTDSMITIKKGLSLDATHGELLRLKDRVSKKITSNEQKKAAIPVIGTF